MANTILTSHAFVEGPPLVHDAVEEQVPMAEESIYPRWFYSSQAPAGRVFDTQAALDAASAEGPWFTDPTSAAEAATTAPAVPAPAPEDEPEEPPTRRSHR